MLLRLAGMFAVAAAFTAVPSFAGGDAPAAAPTSVLVQTVALKKGSLPRIIVAYGTVEANPAARDSLMAPVAAIVADVYVRVGQRVAKGSPLVELTPTPQTRAAYVSAVSAQRVASDALLRTRQLRGESLATEPQLAAAEKAESDAREALAALAEQGARGPTILRSPSAAVVTAVAASAHAIVAEGTPLVELARPSGLALVAGVVPALAAAIKVGNPAKVRPVGGSGAVAAKVSLRGAVVDVGSGLVPIEVALPAGALMPGETAQADIATGSVSGYVVPHAAVLVNDSGATYVVQDLHGAAKIVPVQVLLSAGAVDAVDGKLDAAAPLILAGAYQLQDGMKVRFSNTASPAAK